MLRETHKQNTEGQQHSSGTLKYGRVMVGVEREDAVGHWIKYIFSSGVWLEKRSCNYNNHNQCGEDEGNLKGGAERIEGKLPVMKNFQWEKSNRLISLK